MTKAVNLESRVYGALCGVVGGGEREKNREWRKTTYPLDKEDDRLNQTRPLRDSQRVVGRECFSPVKLTAV